MFISEARESHEDLEVVLEREGIVVNGDPCLKVPFNRMTGLELQVVNRTAKQATLQIGGTSRVFGVVPFKLSLGPHAEVPAVLEVVPLLTGEVDVDLRLEMGTQERSFTQRFCVLPTGRLLIRIHDDDARVLPARLEVTGSDGRSYAPDGVPDSPFETDGLLELQLPAGKTILRLAPLKEGKTSAEEEKLIEIEMPVDRTRSLDIQLP